MNLQEQIYRIHEMMGVDPSIQIKKEIEDNFIEIKQKYKEYLDKSKKIIDPYKIIDKFKEYLISKIPDILPQLKIGKGGEKFAYDCFLFIKNLIQEEIKSMGFIKKNTVKLLAGGKESLRKEMNEKDISEYIFLFQNLIDFSFMIGWMDETQKYLDNMGVWGKDNYNWVNRNQKIIKTDIINTIVNNLYS
jgi:hypothetical protein